MLPKRLPPPPLPWRGRRGLAIPLPAQGRPTSQPGPAGETRVHSPHSRGSALEALPASLIGVEEGETKML